MLAVVLVGGVGTRLRPLTNDVPKPMLPIVERPMIARILEWLAGHGVDRAILSLGYQPKAFVAGFPEGSWAGVELDYAAEPEPLDTAGAIRFAALEAGVGTGPFIVVNGDVLTDLDLSALFAFHGSRPAEATIALAPVKDPSAFGVVLTDSEGQVVNFIEKPPADKAPTNLVNAGSYVLEASVLDRIAAGRPVSVEREVFPGLVRDGALFALATDAYWLDTGTPAHYLQAQIDVLFGRRAAFDLSDAVEVREGVRFGAGVVCGGEITGCAYLGAAAVVENGASVEDCVVGAGALVEAGSKLRRSVLLPGAIVRGGAIVDFSIVGPGADIGARAELRGASIVGGGATVPPGTVLDSARFPV